MNAGLSSTERIVGQRSKLQKQYPWKSTCTFLKKLKALHAINLPYPISSSRTTTSARFSQYQVVLTREPASFWRENVVAVDILLPTSLVENVVVGETSYQLLEVFFILRSVEGLTFFNKANSANFSGDSKYNEAVRCCYFLRREKIVS